MVAHSPPPKRELKDRPQDAPAAVAAAAAAVSPAGQAVGGIELPRADEDLLDLQDNAGTGWNGSQQLQIQADVHTGREREEVLDEDVIRDFPNRNNNNLSLIHI